MSLLMYKLHPNDYEGLRKIKNNGAYDLVDRSDEELSVSMSILTSAPSINYTALVPCGVAGVKCDGWCVRTADWCNEKTEKYCADLGVKTSDPRLCSNTTFWQELKWSYVRKSFLQRDPSYYDPIVQELSCNLTDDGQLYPGLRCTGTIKQCYYPQGSPNSYYPTICRDKSDRVFKVGEPCPETPENICWESCDMPGPNCIACTNTTYFQCPHTQRCFHPSLKCDGQPQCAKGEDEDLDKCKIQYYNNDENKGRHKTYKYATFRCKRKMYPDLETFATACDGNPECLDEIDEQNCERTSEFIKYSLASIAIIYLILKYWRKLHKKLFDQLEQKTRQITKSSFNKTVIIRKYFAKHEDYFAIKDMNLLLLHTIFTKTNDETKDMGRHIYALEETKHKSDKNEIFACMHRNMEPLIMQTVIDSQFTGMTEKAIEFLESCCCGRWITICLEYIRAHEWLTDLINTIKRVVKIELQYLDVVKDSFLTYSLYKIVGGHQAIWDFPTEFSIVVVLCMAVSVVVPMMFATLQLVVHNPFLIVTTTLDKEQTRWRRATMTLFCCFLSFLNPILLVNSFEGAKEKTRKLAKVMDGNTIQHMIRTKEIKKQLTSFIIIEHGKY